MKPIDIELTAENVAQRLDYDPITGVFTWRDIGNNRIKVGDVAGHVGKEGYRRIALGRKRVMAHRIAWLMTYGEWPQGFVDHIDGNKLNNSAANLRLATRRDNCRNRTAPKHNKLGLKGVFESSNPARRKKYVALIRVGKRQKTLGYFATPDEAKAAYDAAARVLHGQFYRQ